MPYVNPVIGYWDHLGYTWCMPCWVTSTCIKGDPIDSGNGAAIGCRCDSCGADVGALFDPSNRVPS